MCFLVGSISERKVYGHPLRVEWKLWEAPTEEEIAAAGAAYDPVEEEDGSGVDAEKTNE